VVSGWSLAAQQFLAVIIKRFYYLKRNLKGLFSQILLPALFVCIAMTVALTAPNIEVSGGGSYEAYVVYSSMYIALY
jgi:ATP-binding cassette subfamily A (ABC1) protein 2